MTPEELELFELQQLCIKDPIGSGGPYFVSRDQYQAYLANQFKEVYGAKYPADMSLEDRLAAEIWTANYLKSLKDSE